MLEIRIVMSEMFDNEKQEFLPKEEVTLYLEHSLVSLSKWESEFEKPFLDEEEKTDAEILGYIRHMILNENYPLDIFQKFTQKNTDDIQAYIGRKMTATWFSERNNARSNGQKITSELIYYWMTSYRIPWEAQNWHLNRLFTLIKVFNANQEKPKKMTPAEAAKQRHSLNEARMRKYNTSG